MLMRAATVVQVLQDLFYVLLHVLFYLWSLLNENSTAAVADTTVQFHSTTTTLPRRSRKTTTTTTTTTDSTGDHAHVMTSSVLDEDDEDVQNANTPDELTSSSSVIRLPQLHQHQQQTTDHLTQIGTLWCSFLWGSYTYKTTHNTSIVVIILSPFWRPMHFSAVPPFPRPILSVCLEHLEHCENGET